MGKQEYKCTKCGLEIVIFKEGGHYLPKAECQDCGEMTMRPMRDLPDKLHINSDYEITELLTLDGVERILLSPSKCYLNDDIVQLEGVIEEIVRRYNEKPKLYQLHHQDKEDFSCVMVSQSEIGSSEAMREWQKEVSVSHPLPDGKQWLICNEKSERFEIPQSVKIGK